MEAGAQISLAYEERDPHSGNQLTCTPFGKMSRNGTGNGLLL